MSDRKITELSLADSTDITSSNAVLHLVNPDRVLDVDKNRKLTLVDNVVLTSGNQTIDGTKTFSSAIAADITGNAATVTNGVYTSRNVSAGTGLTGGGALSSDVTLSHADTSSQASVNNSGNTVIQDVTLDTYGHVTGLASATLSIPTVNNNTITLSAGSGISGGGAITLNQNFNETITFSHTDTSSQGSVNNSSGTVIQDVTLDTYGHVTALGSVNLDGRYYTESESNARYYQIDRQAGISVGPSGVGATYTYTMPAMSANQLMLYSANWRASDSTGNSVWTIKAPSGGTYQWVNATCIGPTTSFEATPASNTTVAGGATIATLSIRRGEIHKVNIIMFRVT